MTARRWLLLPALGGVGAFLLIFGHESGPDGGIFVGDLTGDVVAVGRGEPGGGVRTTTFHKRNRNIPDLVGARAVVAGSDLTLIVMHAKAVALDKNLIAIHWRISLNAGGIRRTTVAVSLLSDRGPGRLSARLPDGPIARPIIDGNLLTVRIPLERIEAMDSIDELAIYLESSHYDEHTRQGDMFKDDLGPTPFPLPSLRSQRSA